MSGSVFLDEDGFLGAIHIPVLGAERAIAVEVVCSQCVSFLFEAETGVKSVFEFNRGRAFGR